MKQLCIYYDKKNEASDMYLKWLEKSCKENDIDVKVVDNFGSMMFYGASETPILPMMPLEDDRVLAYLAEHPKLDVDNISGKSIYVDATAWGIYSYIRANYTREKRIAVIGRGKVGKALIDCLIDFGYTVYEFNSKSNVAIMKDICSSYSDVVVGLSSVPMFDNEFCDELTLKGVELVDSGCNFDTKNKLRCGKWTRDTIISRINNLLDA